MCGNYFLDIVNNSNNILYNSGKLKYIYYLQIKIVTLGKQL